MTNKFGWCLDGNDATCIQEFSWNNSPVKCGCDCHKEVTNDKTTKQGKPASTRKRKTASN